ncbi:MAG TPA: Imm1 family immunity protein [Amycolatopsis sp.]|nr:Imm1 family immunity protein [Amycolatopsis sp.]
MIEAWYDEDDRGTLRYVGDINPEGAFSRNADAPFPLPETGEVTYYYMRNERPYPADAEIPVAVVRQAAHDFLTSGGQRPSGLSWTEQGSPA